ncbi:MAG: hypothetical protein ACI3VB_09930 [Oscillospiraceae bacterium]
MVNKYYRYPNYELWDDACWQGRLRSPLYPLVQWLGAADKMTPRKYGHPVDGLYGEACEKLPCYTVKTNSVAVPEVTEYWKNKGLFYTARSIGGVRWIVCGPLSALTDKTKKLKTLVTFCLEDYSDPYWTMKVLEDHEDYLNMAAEEHETILMFIATEGPEKNGFFVEILQEASTCFPIDKNRLYLNVTLLEKSGKSLSDIEGYTYTDAEGKPMEDPDSAITPFGELDIPSLNISGRWAVLYSLNRKQILIDTFSSLYYDRERMLHSATAERMMEGIAMDRRFLSCEQEGFAEYWDNMGLKYEVHYTKGERWLTFTPKSLLESENEKLPLLIVMQEVGSANDHLAITSINYCYEACKLAAQGEFMALFFVLEDPDSNELLMEILDEAVKTYPIDQSRLYIMGHSHNGKYSLEFFRHHPKMLAAAAILGNTPGLMGITGNVPGSDDTDEKVEASSREDMPLINMVGNCEHKIYFPIGGKQTGKRGLGAGALKVGENVEECIEAWQRRLKAHNCPVKSREEIIASLESNDYVTRFFGFPTDRTDLLYLDGVNHYIGDIKNNNGKYHLRMVGIDNLPHLPSPSMIDLAWSFMKRFKRDRETGEVIELY